MNANVLGIRRTQWVVYDRTKQGITQKLCDPLRLRVTNVLALMITQAAALIEKRFRSGTLR